MARFLAIKDFLKFQHYHDRRPPWIKLYATLLTNAEFLQLPEAAQAQLVKLWLLASQQGHPLPNNPKLIAGQIGTQGRFQLAVIIAAGFVYETDDSASESGEETLAKVEDSASTSSPEALAKSSNGASKVLEKPYPLARADARSRQSSEFREQKKTPIVPTFDEQRVVDHYRATHPRRKTGDPEARVVRKALALDYTADELIEAIDGNARDEWHIARHKHELSYVLRNVEKIDTFRAAAVQAPLVDPATGIPTAAGLAVMRGDR